MRSRVLILNGTITSLLLVGMTIGSGQAPVAPPAPAPAIALPASPWFVDDEAYAEALTTKLSKLAAGGKCIDPDRLAERISKDRSQRFTLPPAGTTALLPEDVYEKALASTWVVGCVLKAEGDEYEEGWFATAWVLHSDGYLVTNAHVFEDAEDAYFGVANQKGEVFPVRDIVVFDKKNDVAVLKIDAKELPALPVAAEAARVGSWVGVLSHPGHQWFTYTQGTVTRYTKNFGGGEELAGAKWMSLTADYAGGSSGAPILNRFGAVVGMACLTSNIDYDGDDLAPMPEKPKVEAVPKGPESRVQMIVKLAVPGIVLRKMVDDQAVKPK
ncbi:MAG: S1 family peptidase [Gemmataceae bacterium]